jgi:heptosyltransferase-2
MNERHQIHYYLELAKAISASIESPSISIQATAGEKEQAWKLLAAEGVRAGSPYIVLNPGAAYGSAKRWEGHRFAEVADLLSRDLASHIVIIGSEAERPIAEEIQRKTMYRTAVLSGKTSLETLIGVLSESSLMITNDSGPMHISAALGIPTVAIFGATNDIATGPYGPNTRVVKHPVECSPCMLRECPIDHRCMSGITAEDVYRAASKLLADV